MRRATFFLGLALLVLLLGNCKIGRNKQDMGLCNTTGTFVDYSHIDGCTYLLVLENGDKLLPATILDTSFLPEDGMRVLFGYVELDEAVTICMAEDLVVEVTCIKRIDP